MIEKYVRYPAIDMNCLESGEFRIFKDRIEMWFYKDGKLELRHMSLRKVT